MRTYLVADNHYWQLRARLKRDLYAREPINDAPRQIANRDRLSPPLHPTLNNREGQHDHV